MDYKIGNIVANTDIGVELDLGHLKRAMKNCIFDPEIYYALIYKVKKPKLSILVNRSGKIIFTGAKSLTDIALARKLFFNDLISMGYHPKKKKIHTQNILITTQIKLLKPTQQILKTKLVKSAKFDPEHFQGIILHNDNPKFAAIIFMTGTIIIVGINNFKIIRSILRLIEEVVTAGEASLEVGC